MRALVLLAGIACCGAFQSPAILQRATGASRYAAVVSHGRHRARLSPVLMAASDVDVLVIGGGISGLTTAVYADKVRLNAI